MNKKFRIAFETDNAKDKVDAYSSIYNNLIKDKKLKEIAFMISDLWDSIGDKNPTIGEIGFLNHIYANGYIDINAIEKLAQWNLAVFKKVGRDKPFSRMLIDLYGNFETILSNQNFLAGNAAGYWFTFEGFTNEVKKYFDIEENWDKMNSNIRERLISQSLSTFNVNILKIEWEDKFDELKKIYIRKNNAVIKNKTKTINIPIERVFRVHPFDNTICMKKFEEKGKIYSQFNYIYDKVLYIAKCNPKSFPSIFDLEKEIFLIDSCAEQIIFSVCNNLFPELEESKIDPHYVFNSPNFEALLDEKDWNNEFFVILNSLILKTFNFWREFDYGQKYKGESIRNILYHRRQVGGVSRKEITRYHERQREVLIGLMNVYYWAVLFFEGRKEKTHTSGRRENK